MTGEIYIIKNFANNKIYIGQTITGSQNRFTQHLNEAFAEGRKEYNYYLSRAIRKYGRESFDFAILADDVPEEDLNLIEEHYIDLYNSTDPNIGYNISNGSNDTSNFEKYQKLEIDDETVDFPDITDEDVDRLLKEL